MSFLISYIYVYCQCLVAILQRAEVLLQFLTMGEAEAVAENHNIVRREWLTIILVHQGCNATFIEVIIWIYHIYVVTFPVSFVITQHHFFGILGQTIAICNEPCAKNGL